MFKSIENSKELWKPVKGFESVYQISNHGRLKSFKSDKKGRILSNVNKKGGYLSVVLKNGSCKKYTRIHRLVAEHFIKNPLNKKEVNHKDLNKQNNHYKNLEWVTPKENMKHAIKNNSNITKGIINYNKYIKPRKIIQLNKNLEFINVFNNAKEANEKTSVCARNILQVANKTEYKQGKTRKQAGGFVWVFEADYEN